MKRITKLLLGISVWFAIGVFSIVLGWTHFVTYVIGAYLYLTFVLPYEEEQYEI